MYEGSILLLDLYCLLTHQDIPKIQYNIGNINKTFFNNLDIMLDKRYRRKDMALDLYNLKNLLFNKSLYNEKLISNLYWHKLLSVVSFFQR